MAGLFFCTLLILIREESKYSWLSLRHLTFQKQLCNRGISLKDQNICGTSQLGNSVSKLMTAKRLVRHCLNITLCSRRFSLHSLMLKSMKYIVIQGIFKRRWNWTFAQFYSPSGRPRYRWVCFFIRRDLEKCSITSPAHRCILCSDCRLVDNEQTLRQPRSYLYKITRWSW